MTRRRSTALAGTLVSLVLVAGCSGGGDPSATPATSGSSTATTSASETSGSPTPTATSPTPAAARPAAPPQSACYRVGTRDLTRPTNASTPVSCRRTHTSRTIHVGRLDTVVDGHAVAVDSAAVQRQLSTTCPARLASYLGGSEETRRLSRFNVVWYSPTLAQSDAGADWFRCDLVGFGTGEQLLPLPRKGSLKGVLGRGGALATYGLCGTAAPGAAGFTRIICGRPHSWRAIDTIGLSGGAAYPGTSTVRRAGDGPCKDRAREAAADTLTFRYGWEWPTRAQWARGQRYGFCWTPDR